MNSNANLSHLDLPRGAPRENGADEPARQRLLRRGEWMVPVLP